jgi:hypothetical protein
MTQTAARSAAAAAVTMVVLSATHGAATANASLLAQWNFDESGGQVVHDDGPFGLDGTLGASSDVDVRDPERIGGALRFNGSSIVVLPDSSRLAPEHLTVEARARADASPGSHRYLVSKGGTGCWAGSYGLYTATQQGLAFYVFDGTQYLVSATARPQDVWDGAWHDVKGTFDGTELRLFVDGREVGAPMQAKLRISYATLTNAAAIGQYVGPCNLPFVGDIDRVRILSDAQEPPVNPASPSEPALPPLPAAAPGTTLPGPPHGTTPPAAKSPACEVRLSRHSMPASRRTIIRARLVNAPRKSKLRLVARRGTQRKAITSARVSASGHARLVVRSQRAGRLTIRVVGKTGCASARLTVVSPKRPAK